MHCENVIIPKAHLAQQMLFGIVLQHICHVLIVVDDSSSFSLASSFPPLLSSDWSPHRQVLHGRNTLLLQVFFYLILIHPFNSGTSPQFGYL